MAKALKANKDRVDKTVQTLMMVVQEPASVHRGMPLELLRGPLQTIVNDPVAFGLNRPGADRDDENDSESEEGAVELTGGFVSRMHQQDGVADREATLQIVAAERRKTLDSNFASGGKYQTNVRLTLWDGEHTMAGVVDTRATAAAEDIWDVGNVIRIRNFTCLPYSPGDDTSVYKIALLFHDVRFLEARLVEIGLRLLPRSMLYRLTAFRVRRPPP